MINEKQLTKMSTSGIVINAINFQLLWFCCVIFADLRALVALLVFFLIHVATPHTQIKEWRYVVFFVIAGVIVESVMASSGLISFTGQFHFIGGDHINLIFPPLWLIALWAGFAACMDHCLRPLLMRPILFWPAIIIGVPASYALGAKLSGSAVHGMPLVFLSCELLLWIILLMVFIRYVKTKI